MVNRATTITITTSTGACFTRVIATTPSATEDERASDERRGAAAATPARGRLLSINFN